ncbi:hypothetical protein BG000_006935 [Podila horticola]|nr:hypothetical protein BG000_006935 [Podila horticola]
MSLVALNSAQAYGAVGHTLTGQIAQRLLTPETAQQINTILFPNFDGLLSKASLWADQVRRDDPPDTCHFEYVFAGKDVINGLFNMTSQLQQYMNTEPTTLEEILACKEALSFFVHFMGDVHQPLHICGKDRGGGLAPVQWRRAHSNLHKVWDSQLIMKDIKDRFDNDPKAYLDNIVDMTSGIWQLEASNWTFCDPDKNQEAHPWESTKLTTSLCPIEWARDMNQLNCQFVWKDYDKDRDYSQDYFETMTGKDNGFMVQKLIAMSGVRMAAILNQIYDPR